MTEYKDDSSATGKDTDANDNLLSPSNRPTPAMIEKFVIRLPKGLRNKIKHLSEQNRRSMNSEIIMVLEKHIQQNLSSPLDLESDAASVTSLLESAASSAELQQPSDDELSKRLQNLPEEKKQALLELLG